jgi:hypothetical protein
MSLKVVNKQDLSQKSLSANNFQVDWVRNPYWLELPDISNEEAIVILMRVDNSSTIPQFRCQQNYTVDWGDGSSPEDFNNNSVAEHIYDYNDANSTNENELGYRQVIIKITPQPGSNLTKFNVGGSSTYLQLNYPKKFLEIKINAQNINNLNFSGCKLLESVLIQKIDNENMTSLNGLFRDCGSLRSISMPSYFPDVTNIGSIFYGCLVLQKLPPLFVGQLSSVANAFYFCRSLKKVPFFDISQCTSVSSTFSGCSSLEELPDWDYSNITNFAYFAINCSSIKKLPNNFDSSKGKNFHSAFQSCVCLYDASKLDISKATNLRNTFLDCRLLSVVGDKLDTSSATDLNGTFNLVQSLTFPPLDISAGASTMVQNSFRGCNQMFELTLINASGITSIDNQVFSASTSVQSLSRLVASGLAVSINISNKNFSGDSLNETFTSLGTVSSGSATITVTGNYGVNEVSYDPTIAENKGWTVAD